MDTAKRQDPDRVREHTAQSINAELDSGAAQRVQMDAQLSPRAIERRLEQLSREWDIERTLETNASLVALTGTVLATTHSRRWLVVPTTVLSFLLLHAVQGWCPPLPIFRRLGVRTREEIERERYALMAARGDFERVNSVSDSNKGRAAWQATAPTH